MSAFALPLRVPFWAPLLAISRTETAFFGVSHQTVPLLLKALLGTHMCVNFIPLPLSSCAVSVLRRAMIRRHLALLCADRRAQSRLDSTSSPDSPSAPSPLRSDSPLRPLQSAIAATPPPLVTHAPNPLLKALHERLGDSSPLLRRPLPPVSPRPLISPFRPATPSSPRPAKRRPRSMPFSIGLIRLIMYSTGLPEFLVPYAVASPAYAAAVAAFMGRERLMEAIASEKQHQALSPRDPTRTSPQGEPAEAEPQNDNQGECGDNTPRDAQRGPEEPTLTLPREDGLMSSRPQHGPCRVAAA